MRRSRTLRYLAARSRPFKTRWRNCFAMLAVLSGTGRRGSVVSEIARIDSLLAGFCLTIDMADPVRTDLNPTRDVLGALLAHGADSAASKAEIANAIIEANRYPL